MALLDRFGLSGRGALITGSSRGIGRAILLGLAECGADVAVHCAGNLLEAERVAEEARGHGATACAISADLSEEGAAGRLFGEAVDGLGRVDVLVLNASVQVRRPWGEISREEFDLQVAVNLRASLELAQLALPPMAQRGWGRMLSLGSVQQERPHPEMLAYAATKQAQLSVVRGLAKQVAGRGVTVNNLAPGVILTDRNAEALSDPAYRDGVTGSIPAGRLGEPEDCVGAALLLCSDAGSYVTGQDLYVDGGMGLG